MRFFVYICIIMFLAHQVLSHRYPDDPKLTFETLPTYDAEYVELLEDDDTLATHLGNLAKAQFGANKVKLIMEKLVARAESVKDDCDLLGRSSTFTSQVVVIAVVTPAGPVLGGTGGDVYAPIFFFPCKAVTIGLWKYANVIAVIAEIALEILDIALFELTNGVAVVTVCCFVNCIIYFTMLPH